MHLVRRAYAAAVGLAALVLFVPSTPAGEIMRVRADPWMPFNGSEPSAPGYTIEVLQAIFQPLGVEIQYQDQSWASALAGCRTGEVDAVPCANLKEGAGLTFPEETISMLKYCVFTLKSASWTYAGEASFKGARIGAAAGYSYWEALDHFIATRPEAITTLAPEDTCWDGVQKLQAKAIDVLPECPQVFYWTLKRHGIDGRSFRIAGSVSGEPVFIVFRPGAKGRAWAKTFDEGIRRLRQNGQLAKILSKYAVEDWK